jgi:formamidopyrimidine-DNA glycosylase
MIELPEALVIARQMNQSIEGKRIASAIKGHSPHKFAFSSGTAEEYEAILVDRTIGKARGHGSAILVPIEPGHVLVLGGGGERITIHQEDRTLPKKHHLLLHFADGTHLSVTVQGWGNVLLLPEAEAPNHPHVAAARIAPLSEAFTWGWFHKRFEEVDETSTKSAKFFLISEPGMWGIGNGCLQDILYRARIHPKRRVVSISGDEQRALYHAIQDTLRQMVEQGGRDSERDLYGNRGGYVRILDSRTKGQPCPECGTLIEKSQYLGGAIYFCPTCQV